MKTIAASIEPLESRIAPAVFFTVFDVDGDLVTIRISKGQPPDATHAGDADISFSPDGPFVLLGGGNVERLKLMSNPVFNGANITITAQRQDADGDGILDGDGYVRVGSIDATGIDLGVVKVDGDLGQIFAGSGTDPAKGLDLLKTASLGRLGTSFGAPGLAVTVSGKLGALKVAGDVVGTLIFANSIGKVTIGGSLIGGADTDSGKITTAAGGAIGAVNIGGNLQGGDGVFSGTIYATGTLGPVTIGGSVIGGNGDQQAGLIRSFGAMGLVKVRGNLEGGNSAFSGRIESNGNVTSVTVGGSLIGKAQDTGAIRCSGVLGPVKIGGSIEAARADLPSSESNSGSIVVTGRMTSVTIGGSLIGGIGTKTGIISCDGAIGAVTIGGDLVGGEFAPSVNQFDTGFIEGKRIGSIFIGGSIIAGSESGGPNLFKSGAIRADDDIGPITVKGSLIGNAGVSVLIIARGQANPGTTTDVAIQSITVRGRVEYADILAGYTVTGISPPASANADAQIGTVSVGGDWIASRLAAGTNIGADMIAGTDDDSFGAGNASIMSKIAKIAIKGAVLGTPMNVSATDSFRFMAQKIGSFKTGGGPIALTAGADNIPVGATFDTHLFDNG